MSGNSSFKNILKSHKGGQEPQAEESAPPSPAPPAATETKAAPKARRTPSQNDEPKRKPGRPNGKRSNTDYIQITAYIRKDTHRKVKQILFDTEDPRDVSELMEELLAKWVMSRT